MLSKSVAHEICTHFVKDVGFSRGSDLINLGVSVLTYNAKELFFIKLKTMIMKWYHLNLNASEYGL